MGRVSQETISKLNDFIESLPQEARQKCALCNETLTHIVKQAEVQTGAGTATVTKVLSEKMNEGAAPGDQVNGNALRVKVQRQEGICTNRANKSSSPKPKKEPAYAIATEAMQIVVTDPKETISMILEQIGEATTAEIMNESSMVSTECKDRIPDALRILESEGKVTKRLSKEKKGYVWSLAQ